MNTLRAIVESGSAVLSAETVLAAIAGQCSDAVAARVRSVLEYAVTTPLYAEGGIADSDPVLTLEFQKVFTRAEVAVFLVDLGAVPEGGHGWLASL